MGMRGAVAKPAELKLLEGNRGNRPIDLNAMFRPEVGAPPRPKGLSREARKAWTRLVPELVRYNLLSKVDADALEDLCETIGMIQVLRRSINARRELLRAEGKDPAGAIEAITPNGLSIQSAAYQALNRERQMLRTWVAEFGLDPAQRARVTTAIRTQLQLFEGGKGAAPEASGNDPIGFSDFD